MRRKSFLKSTISLGLAAMLLIAGSSTVFAYVTTGSKNTYVNKSIAGTNWRVAEVYTSTVGEATSYAPGTETVRRISTLTVGKNSNYNYGADKYIAQSQNHQIKAYLDKSYTNPSTVRFTDISTDEGKSYSSGMDPMVEYALETAWSYITSVTQLPLASPLSLIPTSTGTVVTKYTDLSGFTASFNNKPQDQGVDYLIYINKNTSGVVPSGYYNISVEGKADIGYVYDGVLDPPTSYQNIQSVTLKHFADFSIR